MSILTPTGATPFSLTYDIEVVLPLKVEIPSLRVSLKVLVIDEDYRAMRLQELELLDEKCWKYSRLCDLLRGGVN